MRELFLRSLQLARTQGLLRGRSLQVALDTTPILGRGAVKDTYNLLADGIRQLLRTLARVQETELAAWAEGQGLARVFPRWESAVAAGSVGWARAWLGQARLGPLSAAL